MKDSYLNRIPEKLYISKVISCCQHLSVVAKTCCCYLGNLANHWPDALTGAP